MLSGGEALAELPVAPTDALTLRQGRVGLAKKRWEELSWM